MSNKVIGAIIAVVVLALAGIYWLGLRADTAPEAVITSFAECVEAGNAIMESYPEQCRTEDGRTFVNPDQVLPVEPDGGIGDGAGPPTSTTPPEGVNSGIPEGVACTMDAMMCPDGSYVGRTGPNCEFVCPSE